MNGAPPALPQINTVAINNNNNNNNNANQPKPVDFSNLLHFEVEIQQGSFKSFFFRPDDDVKVTAKDFCDKYNIPHLTAALAFQIEKHAAEL